MKSNDVRIREATPEDLDQIVRFNSALAAETEDTTLNQEHLVVGVREALADTNRCQYYLAEIDGTIVGQTMFTTEWSDWRNGYFWWIQSVYIDTAYRRRGIFRLLYEHIRNKAKLRSEVCGIRLYVHKENLRAIETYRRMGMILTHYLVCEETWSTPVSNH